MKCVCFPVHTVLAPVKDAEISVDITITTAQSYCKRLQQPGFRISSASVCPTPCGTHRSRRISPRTGPAAAAVAGSPAGHSHSRSHTPSPVPVPAMPASPVASRRSSFSSCSSCSSSSSQLHTPTSSPAPSRRSPVYVSPPGSATGSPAASPGRSPCLDSPMASFVLLGESGAAAAAAAAAAAEARMSPTQLPPSQHQLQLQGKLGHVPKLALSGCPRPRSQSASAATCCAAGAGTAISGPTAASPLEGVTRDALSSAGLDNSDSLLSPSPPPPCEARLAKSPPTAAVLHPMPSPRDSLTQTLCHVEELLRPLGLTIEDSGPTTTAAAAATVSTPPNSILGQISREKEECSSQVKQLRAEVAAFQATNKQLVDENKQLLQLVQSTENASQTLLISDTPELDGLPSVALAGKLLVLSQYLRSETNLRKSLQEKTQVLTARLNKRKNWKRSLLELQQACKEQAFFVHSLQNENARIPEYQDACRKQEKVVVRLAQLLQDSVNENQLKLRMVAEQAGQHGVPRTQLGAVTRFVHKSEPSSPRKHSEPTSPRKHSEPSSPRKQ
eukprot:TRINITY_DN27_c2_g3_i3.p1 TRINITY_DN27_c2_g3~~TRINITY_DN27_c2_g3_i3.p1  ORF type:complete len:559 (-),score=109.09 TRINITY_DN27_c2_g3_i3:89-1765(-)